MFILRLFDDRARLGNYQISSEGVDQRAVRAFEQIELHARISRQSISRSINTINQSAMMRTTKSQNSIDEGRLAGVRSGKPQVARPKCIT